jgi:hypothetical protein
MKHLPRSTVLLGLLLIALVTTLLGFAIARRSPQGAVQTRVAHQLVADFQNHLGLSTDHGMPLSTPGYLEVLLLLSIILVAMFLWRSWPSAPVDADQQRSESPRS